MIYKMNLCKPKDLKASLLDWRYFAPKNGVFYPENLIFILDEILVYPSKKKGYVEEILTNIPIPYLEVEIEKHDSSYEKNYYYELKGRLKDGIYAFSVYKKNPYTKEDECFKEVLATPEEVFDYYTKHELGEWRDYLSHALEEGKKASELGETIKLYPQILINAKVNSNKKYDYEKDKEIKSAIEKLEKEFAGNGRVLIRPSGTEPLVRVMIEGENQEYITKKAREIADLIEEKLK